MTFYKTSSVEVVAEALADTIKRHLAAGEPVFWIVSGGSSIAVSSLVSKQLADVPLDKLTVTLADERYGPVGHTDSNWRQLNAAGFSLPRAKLLPILSGKDEQTTCDDFKVALEQNLSAGNYKIGLFGIGTDGHTAGILPNSPAASSVELAACYQADFNRITMTPTAIAKLNEAIAFTGGEGKHQALDQLEQTLSVTQQPAQALKTVKQFSVYNDYKGEAL